ncbi:cell division protein FtsQ/DivIB [Sphingomonas qomolangmaensis]|uniref:Cell division protein FtsQ n=1 Tax=Sphingomonas qomolangmaensis TaxID=2918765 RepID=A0ABY5LD52_9SPHN|nr:cell division protein FtsQ/DivIB [Sphingomonas qomolangmaensis]UUL84337.1 FtsQ-type POTRA domain-containing protein [Sphingomonas qomolangmaensis]
MTQRRSAQKRGAPAKRKQPAKRSRKASILDRTIAVLPVSELALRRAAAWTFAIAAGAGAIGIASFFGVPGAIGVAVAEGMGRAGLRVDQVEVSGLERMERMSVYAVALEQQSRAMPLVDLNEVRDRLLRYGWIADARVSRRLPDTLVIDIVERTPAAIWQNNGQLMLIDEAGTLLEPVRADAMPNLPLVVGDGANAQEPAYQRLMAAAPALRPMVRAATWVGDRRWDLQFVSGEVLLLPAGEEPAAKALVKFAELDGRDRLLGGHYSRFDLRDPTKLVMRRKSGVEKVAPVVGEDPPTTVRPE